MPKEVFVPAHPFKEGFRESYKYGRRRKKGQEGFAGPVYLVDYYGRGKFSGQSSSGTLTIKDNEIPLYVGDRDINGNLGAYLRRTISKMLLDKGINIPQYDIKLKIRSMGHEGFYGPGGYSSPDYTPLGDEHRGGLDSIW